MVDYENLVGRGRLDRFHELHGPECVNDDNWILYADGAKREVCAEGALIEPPGEPAEKHRRIVKFHRLKLQRAIQEFTSRKASLVEHCRTAQTNPQCFPPSDESLAHLKGLQKTVMAMRRNLVQAEADLAKVIPLNERGESPDYLQELTQRVASELAKITI